jgi:hypothetical protein
MIVSCALGDKLDQATVQSEMADDGAEGVTAQTGANIDSTPWATIYVDGQSLGITPIVKRSLPAGRHKLKAVAKDGRTKEMSIDIPSGRLAKTIQLTW